jgi:RNA polymerase sigma-70 factor, ECF subfamily
MLPWFFDKKVIDNVSSIKSASLFRIVEVHRLDRRGAQGANPGDDWDWEEVRRVCMRFAYRYAKSKIEAEDIAQDAVLRAWKCRASLRDPDRRKTWLAAIVRNEAFREYGRKRPTLLDTLEALEGADDQRVLATVERADLHAALETLNERDRQLVRLRYDEDMTQTAIARRLGIPDGTVKVRLHRVRAKLRRVLDIDLV